MARLAASAESLASALISSATTANPLPLCPALAASMEALRDRRLVWEAISSMVLAMPEISLETSVIFDMASTTSCILSAPSAEVFLTSSAICFPSAMEFVSDLVCSKTVVTEAVSSWTEAD